MTDTFAAQLRQLSSADDFLQFFGVPHDKAVVNVSRLHILKRFYQYIRQEPNLPEDNEQALYQCYRTLLIKAYGDFVKSTPAQEKVFKVFQDVDGHQHVTLQNLKATLPSQSGSVPSYTVPAVPAAPHAA
ncbi:MAG: nitrogenase stabilizing/protective protein NifW [Aquabacterium sp.]|uniref:nitrogenase stabilizing/protective protein NifW n=1 Tax=Aquabacterium sp. TaxID=1872578 RepID=UPI0025BA2AB8|nr:nitrogenase stabilizing/protective protein NifW [Aquabacterium sp.]MBI3381647.1 nitrogenase stabilizing/protective protein NifW [Aquabacterium sp.]